MDALQCRDLCRKHPGCQFIFHGPWGGGEGNFCDMLKTTRECPEGFSGWQDKRNLASVMYEVRGAGSGETEEDARMTKIRSLLGSSTAM